MKELTEAAVRATILSCSGTMDGVAVNLGVTSTKLWRFIFSLPYYRKRLERRMDELGETLSDPIDSAFAQALRKQKPWFVSFQKEVAFEITQRPPENGADSSDFDSAPRTPHSAPFSEKS